MEVTDRITGAELLTDAFGRWPSFHDAEVLWIRLDRRPVGDEGGPTVEAMVHVFEMTGEVGDGFLRNHHLVHFRFRDVVELSLDGFNHQNVLFGLAIRDLRERQWEHIHFQVCLDQSFGVGGTWQCHEIEVLSVRPCRRDGSSADAEP